MKDNIQVIVDKFINSKSILFVLHDYLPAPLAYFTKSLATYLTSTDKKVSFFVKSPKGWTKEIVNKNSIVNNLEPLKYKLSFPCTEGDLDVSYAVENGLFTLTVVPETAEFKPEKLTQKIQGATYDLVVSVGISSNNLIIEDLKSASASINKAAFIYTGSYSRQEEYIVIGKGPIYAIESSTLLQKKILSGLAKSGNLAKEFKESLANYLHAVSKYESSINVSQAAQEDSKLETTVAGVLSNINAKVPDQYLEVYRSLFTNMIVTDNNEHVFLPLSRTQLNELDITTDDLKTIFPELPKMNDKKSISLIAEDDKGVFFAVRGKQHFLKEIAVKYDMPFSDVVVEGYISGTHFNDIFGTITEITIGEAQALEFSDEDIIYENTEEDEVVQPGEESIYSTNENGDDELGGNITTDDANDEIVLEPTEEEVATDDGVIPVPVQPLPTIPVTPIDPSTVIPADPTVSQEPVTPIIPVELVPSEPNVPVDPNDVDPALTLIQQANNQMKKTIPKSKNLDFAQIARKIKENIVE